MKGKRYGTEDKVRILREVDGGKSIVEVCREKNISDVTFHRWRQQFGHLNLNEARRLKELERENTELKKMLADAMLAKKVLEYALEKNCEPGAQQAGRGRGRAGGGVLRASGLPDPGVVPVGLRIPGRTMVQPVAGAGEAHPCPDGG